MYICIYIERETKSARGRVSACVEERENESEREIEFHLRSREAARDNMHVCIFIEGCIYRERVSERKRERERERGRERKREKEREGERKSKRETKRQRERDRGRARACEQTCVCMRVFVCVCV